MKKHPNNWWWCWNFSKISKMVRSRTGGRRRLQSNSNKWSRVDRTKF